MTTQPIRMLSGLLGVCIADALGVPVEFTSRRDRALDPVQSMRGYGTWNQPPGTWSDDSSLMLCLAEAMCEGFDLARIAQNFCRWYTEAYWTPHNEVFDIGNTTATAIARLLQGTSPLQSGSTDERSNGNGSLMRILPIAFYAEQLEFTALIQRTHQVSCITHAHPRSQMACGIYISIAVELLHGCGMEAAYQQGIQHIAPLYQTAPFAEAIDPFQRIFRGAIGQVDCDSIRSGGYVVETLEAALWCLLNTNSYTEAVLQAVNLGGDTDTTAAVTGGLAGLLYGVKAIPAEWITQLARYANIVNLAKRLTIAIGEPA